VPSVPGLYMHVTVLGVEGCQMCLSFTYTYMLLYLCRRVSNVPGLYMHVTVTGVDVCQVCLGCTCMLPYLVYTSSNCAWVVHTCYCTWCRRVSNVSGLYIHVPVLGIDGCQMCLACTYMLLYLV
jgi:hypothetical protein